MKNVANYRADSLAGQSLPGRSRDGEEVLNPTVKIDIHPLPADDGGVLIKVTPPEGPANPNLDHVPCDIVLVVDVSGSMSLDAPNPTNPGETAERNGFSVLDLVKHASLTILESLNERDRLGIVTFSSRAKVRIC